ncbi:MAG: hypothetical protein ACOYMW_16105 [Candidatus Competibacteraceae bacterium]
MATKPNSDRLAGLNWLETRKGCSRYALDCEESIWICDECGLDADPYEGGCEDCHPENFEHEEEDEEEQPA